MDLDYLNQEEPPSQWIVFRPQNSSQVTHARHTLGHSDTGPEVGGISENSLYQS